MKNINYKLQVPMSYELKEKAEKVALDQGFGSLNDAIRLFVHKFAEKKIAVSFDTERFPAEQLEPEFEAELLKIVERANKEDKSTKLKSYSAKELIDNILNSPDETDNSI